MKKKRRFKEQNAFILNRNNQEHSDRRNVAGTESTYLKSLLKPNTTRIYTKTWKIRERDGLTQFAKFREAVWYRGKFCHLVSIISIRWKTDFINKTNTLPSFITKDELSSMICKENEIFLNKSIKLWVFFICIFEYRGILLKCGSTACMGSYPIGCHSRHNLKRKKKDRKVRVYVTFSNK